MSNPAMCEWTLLVFMAADNDLDRFAVKDLHEMERLGSTVSVQVVVQVDRYGDGKKGVALRGKIARNPNWAPFDILFTSKLTDIGETNTGDPDTLRDFVVWGVTNFPAKRYALVIWNHGSGWKPEFIYEKAEESAGYRMAAAMRAVGFGDQYQKKLKRILFRRNAEEAVADFIHQTVGPLLLTTTDSAPGSHLFLASLDAPPSALEPKVRDEDLQNIIVRAIGLDESSSRDALDSIELKSAIANSCRQIELQTGRAFKFDLLGFDACLMAGAEVALQVGEFSVTIVGSEEIEPSIGWQYSLVLDTFAANSRIDAVGIASGAVDCYIEGMRDYKIRLITQSALRTQSLVAFISSLDSVGGLLLELVASQYAVVAKSEKTATRFYDTDFLDIGDFLRLLGTSVTDERISDCAMKLKSLVLASKYSFASAAQVPTGLSVYFPTKPQFNDAYLSLDFASKAPQWVQAIKSYHFIET